MLELKKFRLSDPTPYFTDKRDATVASYILRLLAQDRYMLALLSGMWDLQMLLQPTFKSYLHCGCAGPSHPVMGCSDIKLCIDLYIYI